MARRTSPYVAAKARVSLVDKLLASKVGTGKAKGKMAKHKREMAREFEDEAAELFRKAKEEGGDVFGIPAELLKAGGLMATIFGNPMVAAGINAATTAAIKSKQRKASKGLLKLNEGRWGRTFLGGAAGDYMAEAEKQQIDVGDIATSALMSGAMAAMSAKQIGGKEGLGKAITKARGEGKSIQELISAMEKGGATSGDYGKLIEGKVPSKITGIGGGTTPGQIDIGANFPDLVGTDISKFYTGTGTPNAPIDFSKFMTPAGAGAKTFGQSLANIFGKGESDSKSFAVSKGDTAGMKGLQSITMLPMLLKQLYNR